MFLSSPSCCSKKPRWLVDAIQIDPGRLLPALSAITTRRKLKSLKSKSASSQFSFQSRQRQVFQEGKKMTNLLCFFFFSKCKYMEGFLKCDSSCRRHNPRPLGEPELFHSAIHSNSILIYIFFQTKRKQEEKNSKPRRSVCYVNKLFQEMLLTH